MAKNKKKKKNRNGRASVLGAVAGSVGMVLATAIGQLVADGVEQYLNKGGKKKLRKLMRGMTPQRAS